MKLQIKYHSSSLKVFLYTFLVALLVPIFSYGQEEVIKSRMNLSITQLDDNQIQLEALIRAKIDDRYQGIKGLEVQFGTYNDEEDNELGIATTNEDGIAYLMVEKDNLLVDSTGLFIVESIFDGNDRFKDSDDEVEYILAEMTVENIEADQEEGPSAKSVTVTLTSMEEPVADATVFLYKKALINPLPLGEEVTDENGHATFEFPDNLPGDESGKLDLYVRVDDNIDHGHMETHFSENWGAPVYNEVPEKVGSLTSPNPPLWLLVTFLLLLILIWGHYLEVIYKLFKIKKMV